jgi:tetratricopeptide (TPR) repeat protein
VETLIKTGQYKKSIQFLEKGKFSSVIKYTEKASEWPENLGVGKPFAADNRTENYLTANALEKSGKKSEAVTIFELLAHFKGPVHAQENSKLIFQLLAMKHLNKEQETLELLKHTLDEFPDNPYLKWVASAFREDGKQEKIKNNILNNSTEARPYDISFTDKEFDLVTQVFSMIK